MTIEQLIEEFEGSGSQLKSFILRITASVADTEDIIHDTYIKGTFVVLRQETIFLRDPNDFPGVLSLIPACRQAGLRFYVINYLRHIHNS